MGGLGQLGNQEEPQHHYRKGVLLRGSISIAMKSRMSREAHVRFCERLVAKFLRPTRPILMNLFMHYTFDAWMTRTNPFCPFARYADDAVVHCRTRKQAEELMRSIAGRLAECGLTMHPEKSKVVYCKDSNRTATYPQVHFTFLGFTFRPRRARGAQNRLFTNFLPGVSADALKRMRQVVRGWRI